MLATESPAVSNAAEAVYQISADERMRQKAEARADYLRRQKDIEMNMKWAQQVFRDMDETKAKLDAANAERDALAEEVAKLRAELTRLKTNS